MPLDSLFITWSKTTLVLIFCLASQVVAQPSLELFTANNLSGIKEADGNVLIPAKYQRLGWSDGYDQPVDDVIGYYNKQWGLISTKNKIITPAEYYDLWPVHKDLIIASKKGKFTNHLFYGAIDSKGKTVVDFHYTSIKKIANALIVTQLKDDKIHYGLLSEKNTFLLPAHYSLIRHFANDLYTFADFDGKTGLINRSGQIIMPMTVDSIGLPVAGKALIYNQGKTGLIDQKGQAVLPASYKAVTLSNTDAQLVEFNRYTIVNDRNEIDYEFYCDSLVRLSDKLYAMHLNDHLTFANTAFEALWSGYHVTIHQFSHHRAIISQHEKYGVLDDKGAFFIPMEYDSIGADEGYYYLLKNQEWSIVNKFGRQVSKYAYEDILPESDNLIAVKRRGYWGFIDFQGDEVISPKFDEVTPFRYLTSRVRFLDAYGTINQFGEWICEPVYDTITIHKDGVSEAKTGSRTDLFNNQGEMIFQTYNSLRPYDGGFLEETAEGKTGFLMRDGRIVKHPVFDEIAFTAHDSILIAREDNYLSLATKDGDRFYSLSGRFEEVLGISEDFVGIRLDGKYGFVDLQGRLRIANRYDSVRLFSDGMAAFYLRGNWGYIDKAEKLRVQPVYESSFNYKNGTAIVIEDGRYGVIDKDGNYLLHSEYDYISRNTHGSFKIHNGDKFGLYNAKGQKIVSPDYDLVEEVLPGKTIVKRRGMFGVVNASGRFTIPMMYTNIKYLGEKRYIVVESKTPELRKL